MLNLIPQSRSWKLKRWKRKESHLEVTQQITQIMKKYYCFNIQEQFLDAFNNGDAEMFFALWEDYSLTSDNHKTLEILCSVYFAIYPLLYNYPEKLEISMDRFKAFLERRGEWAQEPEFLQYYALPYLPGIDKTNSRSKITSVISRFI
jgi:hypothetical protein